MARVIEANQAQVCCLAPKRAVNGSKVLPAAEALRLAACGMLCYAVKRRSANVCLSLEAKQFRATDTVKGIYVGGLEAVISTFNALFSEWVQVCV